MTLDPDFCRSLMFLPADNERFRNSALRGSADIIILDLEDAIPASKKDRVRDGIQSAIHDIAEANRICAVRINSGLRLLGKDLEAVICPGLSALTIPKVPSAELLKMIDETVSDLESERDIPVGNIRLIAQIETATGLQNINDIARSTPRLAAIGIGSEDLAADLGSQAEKEILYYPSMQVLIAARSAGIVPLGYLG
ncbi:MAG: aldolase/citrate lyase family protein, partial [Candidatus Latescibacteria bacterium]|nr:aldolase/citrate lyase family protein [Candidatus Latescibacterota bacterium]